MKKYTVKPYPAPSWIFKAVQTLRPVERVPVSQWAEQHRVLPDGNAIPGMWRNSVTPYLVEIMDAFSDEMVEEIVFVKPTQVGGTSSMENMLGSLIAQDPAPTMAVYPSDDLAERVDHSGNRKRNCQQSRDRPGVGCGGRTIQNHLRLQSL